MAEGIRVALVHVRTQRFELLAVLVVGIIAFLATTIEAARLQAVAPSAACLVGRITGSGLLPAGCPSADAFFDLDNREVARLMAAMAVVPAVIGLLALSTLVANEVEHRSAQLAWNLAPSRHRWLAERLFVSGAVVVAAAGLAAVGAQGLERVRIPWFDPGAGFADFGLFGPLLFLRSVAYGGLGLLVGALTGRQVPALLVGSVAAVLLFIATSTLMPYGLDTVPVKSDGPTGSILLIGVRYRSPDGPLIMYPEVVKRAPPGLDESGLADWIAANYPAVEVGLPASDAQQVALREGLFLASITILAVAGSFVVVGRRRPYP